MRSRRRENREEGEKQEKEKRRESSRLGEGGGILKVERDRG